MSTQTDWLELSPSEMSIEVAAIEADSCHLCGKAPWVSKACESFEVRQCQKCEREVCQECCEMDADSDQDGFFICQWICREGCEAA